MPTVREFFLAEANGYLQRLRAIVSSASPSSIDAGELHRLARGLRGSAQMARAEHVQQAAQLLEAAARALTTGALGWSSDAQHRMTLTLEDLAALVQGSESARQMETRVADVAARWHERGVHADGRRDDNRSDDGFQAFAAREVGALAEQLETSLQQLASDPADREPLKAILRRQRTLLGAARLEELPVVAETLQTIDDVTRLVARLGVRVEGEWLEAYRLAREIFASTAAALERGDRSTPPGTAPNRLRTVRQELLERHGPALRGEGAGQPQEQAQAAAPDDSEVVAIETLLYRGEAALTRALELLPRIERAAAGDDEARAAVAELADLLRHARA